MNLLAEAASAAPDTMISGNWLILVIGALFSGAALLLGKVQGKKEGLKEASNITLQNPVPEVPTRKVSTPPSWDAHRALVDRVTALEMVTQELRRDAAHQYHELMTAGAAREQSISDKLDGIARGIHSRIDAFMKPKSAR